MSMIKACPNRVRMVRHVSQSQEPVRDVLVAYAEFNRLLTDWLLNQPVGLNAREERDFIAWRASLAASNATPTRSAEIESSANQKTSWRHDRVQTLLDTGLC